MTRFLALVVILMLALQAFSQDIPQLRARQSTKDIMHWMDTVRSSNDYRGWLDQFNKSVNDYIYYADQSHEDQVRLLLGAKPSGGGEYYSVWLEQTAIKQLNNFYYYATETYRTALGLIKLSEPDCIPVGYYQPWLNRLNESLKNYCYYATDVYKEGLVFLKDVRPASREGDYQSWFTLYNKYLSDYNYYGTEVYKYSCDLLLEVKPVGGDNNGTVTMDFLKNIDQTSIQVLKSEANSHAFIDLISSFKEGLVNQALNGNIWAKAEYTRLKGIFGQN
ncbi:MAG: hypothetical protein PHW04_15600 [Candidatus Wallbacteria bacterium]|nr:hypothetical protein [Candidatus Wallbacteria bacterium]